MINAKHLREYVVRPALVDIGLYSRSAENLLMGTAAQESKLGEYLAQLGNGPARGIFQMEPTTEKDIWNNYLKYKTDLAREILLRVSTPKPQDTDEILYNLRYAAMMARVHYLRIDERLPHADSPADLARYWKKYYNTHKGKGTISEFIKNYELTRQ